MALLPSNQRDQIMVLVAMVALGAAGAYWYLAWSPKQVELTEISARVDSLEQANAKARIEVSRGTASKLRAQAEGFQADLATLRHLVPTGNEVPLLLEQVSTAARRAGLEISAVEPQGVTPGERFDTYKYRIGATGPYHDIGSFLANVGSLQRIVAPINLSLAPASRLRPGVAPPMPGKVVRPPTTQPLDAKFEIQTYVVHAPEFTLVQSGSPAGNAQAVKP